MISRLIIFVIKRYYRSINSRRILAQAIISDLPPVARNMVVESLLPAGKHIHTNPRPRAK